MHFMIYLWTYTRRFTPKYYCQPSGNNNPSLITHSLVVPGPFPLFSLGNKLSTVGVVVLRSEPKTTDLKCSVGQRSEVMGDTYQKPDL